jgi:hypothetical protein
LDSTSGTVTGGSADANSFDSGFWRDQEIAARGNVLGVAYSGAGRVSVELSLDRGATFPLTQLLDPNAVAGTRLVQMAIAPDHTVGLSYWRNNNSGGAPRSELMLIEAAPGAFDVTNTPTGYTWGQPAVVYAAPDSVIPLLMHMEYSSGGDLVVGYGFTSSRAVPSQGAWETAAEFRCAVRPYLGAFVDKELDREASVVPMDPHVSLLGSGSSLEIFYAYEKSDGLHLLHSTNAGQTFQHAWIAPVPGAFMPSVHARMQGTQKRVDVLYCSPTAVGLELHNLHWSDFTPGAPPQVYYLTQSALTPGGTPPPGYPQSYVISTLAWFGYDATIVGDDVAVILHEMHYDAWEFYWTGGVPTAGGTPSSNPAPLLLPGMTGNVAAPDSNHRNQLRLCVLD